MGGGGGLRIEHSKPPAGGESAQQLPHRGTKRLPGQMMKEGEEDQNSNLKQIAG